MIIRREALQAVLPATTDTDTRYFMQAIHAEPAANRVVATNGMVLLIATDRYPQADADFPIVAGAPFHGNPAAPVNLPEEAVRSVIAAMSKKNTIPILSCAQLSTNGSDETVTLAATDLQAPRVATIKRDEGGQFPKYEACFPAERPEVDLCLRVDVLEALIKSAKAVAGKLAVIKFSVAIPMTFEEAEANEADPAAKRKRDVLEAVRVQVSGHDVEVTGLAMPCRI